MTELKRVFVNDKDSYEWCMRLIGASFPPEERRDDDLQKAVLLHPDYRLCIIADNGEAVGAVGYFDAPEFLYFENFCVLARKRNCGYGSAALRLLTRNISKPFILEIEPPADDISRRRKAFYERNGMVENPFRHIQPHYRATDPDLPLVLMSYKTQISQTQYDVFRKYLDDNVDVR